MMRYDILSVYTIRGTQFVMTEDKNILETIKKVELGDLKILIIGVVLLAIPAGLLIFMLSRESSEGFSRESLRHMSSRRSTFNFNTSRRNAPTRGSSRKKAGWFSKETPEMKIERELDEAMKKIERSCRARSSRMGSSNSVRMKSYAAETDFAITSANGAMEQGNYLEAEKYFEDAFQRGDRNVFLKLQAIAGLCEVYSRTENQKNTKRLSIFT